MGMQKAKEFGDVAVRRPDANERLVQHGLGDFDVAEDRHRDPAVSDIETVASGDEGGREGGADPVRGVNVV